MLNPHEFWCDAALDVIPVSESFQRRDTLRRVNPDQTP